MKSRWYHLKLVFLFKSLVLRNHYISYGRMLRMLPAIFRWAPPRIHPAKFSIHETHQNRVAYAIPNDRWWRLWLGMLPNAIIPHVSAQ